MKLILDNVVKNFDEKEVIKGATFEFESGYIYGLLGRNGAGKTTLFNLINEDLKADSGVISVEDEKVRAIEAGDIGYVLSTPIVPDFLTGREFLMFMRRHKKILMKPAIRLSIVLAILMAFIIIIEVSVGELKVEINKIFLNQMPVFLFVMYSINSGKRITEAMFANCDNAMLNYRFYRQPKALLDLFAGRLKYIIFFNMIPTLVLVCGVETIFVLSGGSDNIMDHIVIFVSIIVMSVFFSTHNMVLYYLLQPYTADSKVKSPLYKILHFLTYMVFYVCMTTLKAPTRIFCPVIILFSIIYIAAALLLVYRIAPKTFKLRR